MISDTFKILNVTHESKMKRIKKEKNIVNKRLIQGNQFLGGATYIERKYLLKHKQRKFSFKKYKHLKQDKGNLFEKIYPISK